MLCAVKTAVEALYSERFDMDAVVQRLGGAGEPENLLFAYIAIQVATNLSEPLCDGDIAYGLKLLQSSDNDSLSLNKDLAVLGWSERSKERLDRKILCLGDDYSCDALIYRIEKAKKGPSSHTEREYCQKMAAEVAQLQGELDEYLDEKMSREAAESVLANLIEEVRAESATDADKNPRR
jgi:hypothetical protein